MVIGGRRKVAGPLLVRALNGCSAPREKTPPASSELRVMSCGEKGAATVMKRLDSPAASSPQLSCMHYY
jgi:hypothetical protein